MSAADGTLVALTMAGEAGGQWCLLREREHWHLYRDVTDAPHAEVIMPQDTAWRLFTKGISKDEALAAATIRGDPSLGVKIFDMVSIIA